MLEAVQIGLVAAVIGTAWHLITRAGEVLDVWPVLIDYVTTSEKIHAVLHDCSKCVSGQVALWSFPFIAGSYNAWGHVLAVSCAIIAASLLSRVIFAK